MAVVSGVGYPRARALSPPYHDVHRVVTNLDVLDFGGTGHAPRLPHTHPGVCVDEVLAATSFRLDAAETRPTREPTGEELALLRDLLDPKSLRDKEVSS
ncbi:hypothetical protein [Amycolatopsis sp. FDAARGOS 1241]|uniref:hypothetical protein n=1 Tax=Amycolatopsis sp. FDAARGOS 1241 TaxID=2778070 RepID=UPI00194F61C7|nr:hypothetical protein [Amycolatopsis sp. FDAARGOS 1241]QRP43967.1 hypothetical protein I6J71_32250 [Amycolatopsis sp. FDAARGOS 1241]